MKKIIVGLLFGFAAYLGILKYLRYSYVRENKRLWEKYHPYKP